MASKDNITPEEVEVVENSNDYILNNIGAYLEYIRAWIRRIIDSDGLKYAEPMEKKKIYPEFNYIQFQYLLQRVQQEVYQVNTELLYKYYNNPSNKVYDVDKVKLCYTVYSMLCSYYGFICSLEGFYLFSGIGEHTLKLWLSSGVSDVYKIALENSKNAVVSDFENSKVPLLKLAAGNYKYKLNTPMNERQEVTSIEVLPDLLQLTDSKKTLPEGPKQD